MARILITVEVPNDVDITTDDVRLVLRDAFGEFVDRRGPTTEQYVEKRYAGHTPSFLKVKKQQVARRVEAALLIYKEAEVEVIPTHCHLCKEPFQSWQVDEGRWAHTCEPCENMLEPAHEAIVAGLTVEDWLNKRPIDD